MVKLPWPPHPLEEAGPARTGQEVQKKNLQKFHTKGMYLPLWTQTAHWGTIYHGNPVQWPATKPIRQASTIRGRYLRANKLFCWQVGDPERWPTKTIKLGSKEPCSKAMRKKELNSYGRETEGVCRWMDGYNPRPIQFWHSLGASVAIHSEAPLVKPTHKCEVKIPETQESMITSEVRSMLSKVNTEVGPGNKGFLHTPFHYPFLIPKKNGKSHFIINLKPLNQFITCTNSGWPPWNRSGKPFTQSNGQSHSTSSEHTTTFHSEETSLFSSLHVERQSVPVQGLALWSIHCSQDSNARGLV